MNNRVKKVVSLFLAGVLSLSVIIGSDVANKDKHYVNAWGVYQINPEYYNQDYANCPYNKQEREQLKSQYEAVKIKAKELGEAQRDIDEFLRQERETQQQKRKKNKNGDLE